MRYPVFRTRHVGSATPGAVVESHQLQFSKNPGPSGPEEIAESHSDFARRKFLPTPRGNPRKWGPGKGDYEHEVLIRSRPRRRFGDFAAVGKVTRRPQAAKSPVRKEPSSGPMRASGPTKKRSIIAPSSVWPSASHLSLSPLAFGHLPLIKGAGRRDREEAAKYPALCIYYG